MVSNNLNISVNMFPLTVKSCLFVGRQGGVVNSITMYWDKSYNVDNYIVNSSHNFS